MTRGWRKESARHSLAARGLKVRIPPKSRNYYHAMKSKLKGDVIYPYGHYEEIGPDGCPILIGSSDYSGYQISKKGQSSFSKSAKGALTAVAAYCEPNEPCMIHIYTTEEEPDIDISHCFGDFEVLEEVRYERPIKVKHHKIVTVKPEILEAHAKRCEVVEDSDGFGIESWEHEMRWLKRRLRL